MGVLAGGNEFGPQEYCHGASRWVPLGVLPTKSRWSKLIWQFGDALRALPAKGGAGERTLGVCAWPGVGLRCCGRCERVSCASRGPQQPHLQHGAAVSANDATGLRFSYLSAFARGSPVDTHDVRRPCPCGTRLRPEHVLGRDCHRLTHGHNRGVTRPGMLSQSLRPYRKRLVSSLTALGLLTKTRIKNVGVYRP